MVLKKPGVEMDTARFTLDSPVFGITAGRKLKKTHHFIELDVRNSAMYNLLGIFFGFD